MVNSYVHELASSYWHRGPPTLEIHNDNHDGCPIANLPAKKRLSFSSFRSFRFRFSSFLLLACGVPDAYNASRATRVKNTLDLIIASPDTSPTLPVRHRKFKSQDRKANTLSTKLVARCVEMSTDPGDIVLDPFGGAGTTYDVCERRDRKWIGIEIDFCPTIVERLESDEIHEHNSFDFVEA